MKNSPFSQARESVNMTCTTSIDAMFKRKRGRPPKNRVIEVGALRTSLAETSLGQIYPFDPAPSLPEERLGAEKKRSDQQKKLHVA